MPSRAANPSTIPLDAVLVTGELRERPSRPPEHAAENEARVELAQGLVDAPHSILQLLVEAALRASRPQLGRAGPIDPGPRWCAWRLKPRQQRHQTRLRGF